MNNFEEILAKLKNNKITHEILISDYSKVIEKVNPRINAVVELNSNLFQEAKNFDRLREAKKSMGVLHGLPILIKDTIEVKGMPTTAGYPPLKDYIPNEDAEVVKRLRDAGSIIVGKTNIPELSLDIQTFNSIHGTTNNPWDLTKTAGGSSGGNAAAISSGMAPLALGSDLGGSLRIPASFCGITALRPTEGRVPMDGHIPPLPGNPISTSEITIGPMAKSIKGLEMVMQAICGKSINQEYPDTPFNVVKSQNPNELSIAITSNFPTIPTDNRIIKLMDRIHQELNQNKIKCSFEPNYLPLKRIQMAHNIFYLQLSESKILDETLKSSATDKSPKSSQILAATQIRDDCRNQVNQFLDKYDAWIVPVTSVLPFDHNPNHDKLKINENLVSYWQATISYCIPFTLTGNPVITLPVGIIDKLPVGIQVIGKRWEDEKLISICKLLEEVFGELNPPKMEN